MDLESLRHSTAHVMAAAVKRLFSDVLLDIGPATEDGFYYDFDMPHRLVPEDFPLIEQEMQKIIDSNLPFVKETISREEAKKLFADQKYKLERLADIPEDEPITIYRCGDFFDLCRGPHLKSTGEIKAFKILSVAGSYYRGKETNPMLQRLYGTAMPCKKELVEYLNRIEEARKRDHRKLGKELDLFSVSEDVGPGLIHWHPKGARIRSIIEDFWKKEHFKAGYELLYTPHIGKSFLWQTSGHLDFYKESMYAEMEIDEQKYFIKPMNCPFHIQVYKSKKRSYRELPLRWAELGTVYRYEKAGVLHGLLRVRGFTQDDAHIFCTQEQIESEVKETILFALFMLRAFEFKEINAYLSTRPAKAIGEETRWAKATDSLRKALEESGLSFKIDEGGGAFYGPKVDLKVKDAIGREWQMSTVQFDFNIPERFDITYTGEDGKEHRPYMVHRALLGSLERFFGVLIEHFGGAFPLWLAPEQLIILPITDKQIEYAKNVMSILKEKNFRVSIDESSAKIGAKIRNAQLEKIPYMLVVGEKEAQSGTVAVRTRVEGDIGKMSIEDLTARLIKEAQPPSR